MQIETYADADGSRREDIAALKGDDAVACVPLQCMAVKKPCSPRTARHSRKAQLTTYDTIRQDVLRPVTGAA